MVEIMLDLETMGKGPRAAITQIGAVAFDTYTDSILERFQVHVDMESSVRCGGELDPSTVTWWLGQSDEARRAFSPNVLKTDIREALAAFSRFLRAHECEAGEGLPVWGNGASFDNVILRSAYERIEMQAPWHFWQDRCYRTIKALRKDVTFEHVGVRHRAVDDAEAQALHLLEILKGQRGVDELYSLGRQGLDTFLGIRGKARGLILTCPVCGGWHGHMRELRLQSESNNWFDSGQKVIVLDGECGHTWELVIGEHKGHTYLTARNMSEIATSENPFNPLQRDAAKQAAGASDDAP